MIKNILIAVAIISGMACGVTQGEEIESKIPIQEIIGPLPGNVPFEVTRIVLTAGVWSVSGNINFYESAEKGTVFVVGAINLNAPTIPFDGTEIVTSAQLERPTNVDIATPLPSRLIKVPDSRTVYLVAYSIQPGQPAPACYAWGYLSAQKIRNLTD